MKDILLIKLLFSVMFVLAGIRKLRNPSFDAKRLQERLPLPENIMFYVIILAGLWELVSVFALFQKNKETQLMGVYSLIVFTIAATLLVHFPPKGMSYYPFVSNLAAVGGLLALAKIIK